jgi:hypothetical protein
MKDERHHRTVVSTNVPIRRLATNFIYIFAINYALVFGRVDIRIFILINKKVNQVNKEKNKSNNNADHIKQA